MLILSDQVRIQVQKGAWVDTIAGDSFCVQDVLGGYLQPQSGDNGSSGEESAGTTTGDNSLESLQWQGQKAFERVDKTLVFLALTGDGAVYTGADAAAKHNDIKTKTLSGFAVKSRDSIRNVVMDRRLPGDPKPNNALQEWKWRARQGDSWETYVSGGVPYVNRVRHRRAAPNESLSIDTERVLDAKQGFFLQLDFGAIWSGHNGDSGVRVQWCDGLYSVTWRKIAGRKSDKPQLERFVDGKWQCWQVFGDALDVDFTAPTILQVEYLAGRMLVKIGETTRHFAQVTPAATPSSRDKLTAIKAPSGRVLVSSYGVDVGVGGGLIDYRTTAGKNRAGSFTRRVRTSFRHIGSVPPKVTTGGYHLPTAKTTLAITSATGFVEYTATLQSNGRETPFLTNLTIDFSGDKSSNESDLIDLRPACRSLTYDGGQPDLTPTTQLEIELDRILLDQLIPDWQLACGQFRPLRLDTRSRVLEDNGSITAGAWVNRFDGYILEPAMSTPSFNTQSLKIVAHDKRVRIKEPAGLVDEKYGPLDVRASEDAPLYGGQAVQYLIGVELGSSVADAMNGTGDAMAFFPEGHYPLIGVESYKTLTVPEQSGFLYPPPFDSYLEEWINTLSKDDQAVWYFGFSPLAPDAGMVLMYGRLRLILAALGQTVKLLPDAVYISGDETRVINKIESRSLTDKAYNQVIVRGKRAVDGLAAFLPALFSGRARVSPDDPNSPELAGWLRTRVLQYDFIGTTTDGLFAQTQAALLLHEFEGRTPREVTVTLPRGDWSFFWGQKVEPKMQRVRSDQTIGLNGVTLRTTHVRHALEFDGTDALKRFETTLNARELSGSGF